MSAASLQNSQNPFEAALTRAIERLTLLKACAPKAIRIFPSPSDFQSAGELLKDSFEIFNDYVREIGDEVECNSPYPIHMCDFTAVMADTASDAVTACERIAERLIEDREDA